jgi:lysophospholipase
MNPATVGYVSAARNIKLRWAIWKTMRQPHRGTVLLLAGRGEFLEKYHETATDLTGRGFDVYSFDWRGQGLSSRMLANPQKGYVATYDDYLSDLVHFIQTILTPNAGAPNYLLAHSMGGHLALRYLHDHCDLFKRNILTAPLIDIAMPSFLKTALKVYVRGAVKLGLGSHYVPCGGDRSTQGKPFENNKLTSDRRRFQRTQHQLIETPGLALGGVTHQWLHATFLSIDRLLTAGFLEKIETPVLMVAAGKDTVVSNAAQENVKTRLPQCRLASLENARHEILVEADDIRKHFWKIFDDFLK